MPVVATRQRLAGAAIALSERRRVVVTGLGAVTPVGNDVPTFWSALRDGRSGVAPITRFDASGLDVRIAGEVKDFDPTMYLERKEVRRTDRFTHYAMAAAAQAIADAKLSGDPDRIGIAIASGGGGLETIVAEMQVLRRYGPGAISPSTMPRYIASAAVAEVAVRFGYRGPSITNVAACASSSHAIGDAARAIRRGRADVMVTGGAEASVLPVIMGGFGIVRALSRRNDEPQRASRPFDRDRDGFVLAEGAAVLVLEELEHARRRGAPLYAEVAGYAATADAHHVTAPSPQGEGSARAMGWPWPTRRSRQRRSSTSTPMAPRPAATTAPRHARSGPSSARTVTGSSCRAPSR
jgi:3-oxoacyl-[acyl-carrier-protein] synthase II